MEFRYPEDAGPMGDLVGVRMVQPSGGIYKEDTVGDPYGYLGSWLP